MNFSPNRISDNDLQVKAQAPKSGRQSSGYRSDTMTVANKNHLSFLGPTWTLEDAGLAQRTSDKTTDYELAKPEGKFSKSFPFVVPGDIYSALLKAKAIPDPYYSINEALVQWLRDHDWRIKTQVYN
jgi:hypothetical protein